MQRHHLLIFLDICKVFFVFFSTLDRISEVYDVACTESTRDRCHGLYMLGPYVNDLTHECPQLGVRMPRATNSLLTKRKIKKKEGVSEFAQV